LSKQAHLGSSRGATRWLDRVPFWLDPDIEPDGEYSFNINIGIYFDSASASLVFMNASKIYMSVSAIGGCGKVGTSVTANLILMPTLILNLSHIRFRIHCQLGWIRIGVEKSTSLPIHWEARGKSC